MARTVITQEVVSRDGLNPTQQSADATNDHSIENNPGDLALRIDNAGAGASVWEAIYAQEVDGETVPNKTLSVGAGAVRYFGPFPVTLFGTTISIDVDIDTSVTFEGVRIPRD